MPWLRRQSAWEVRFPILARKGQIMTEILDQTLASAPVETDLVGVVQAILAVTSEPLTLPKIRSSLPAPHRRIGLDELAETLRRQVAANVLFQFPRYRSPQDRFWDRPMTVHIAELLRAVLAEQPLGLSELRRKLPTYAQAQAETVLLEEIAQGRLHRHPRSSGRGSECFGRHRPDPRDYLRGNSQAFFSVWKDLASANTKYVRPPLSCCTMRNGRPRRNKKTMLMS